nr:hypothetical protein [uncultured Actinoplanes sp.]
MTAVIRDRSARGDPFLLEAVPADTLVGDIGDTGAVTFTCNCAGSCQQGLCGGSCCSLPHTALEI